MIDPELLKILVCPVTKVPVKPLSADKLSVLNREIAKGTVRYHDGTSVGAPIDEALITENGRTIYRIDDGIPVMLEDQAIETSQVEGL